MRTYEVELVQPVGCGLGMVYATSVVKARDKNHASLVAFQGLPKGHWIGRVSDPDLPLIAESTDHD